MKTFLPLFALGPSIAGAANASGTTLMAGAAETVITSVKDRPDVYDDLYARALVLADERHRLAIVTLDHGGFPFSYIKVLFGAINKATSIPEDKIIINCSHTHNAPGVDGRSMDTSAEKWLQGSIAELVERAADSLQPATLRVGRAPTQIAYNRRLMKDDGHVTMLPNPNGAVVPWVDVLGVYGESGKRSAVLFSYAAHPVIIHWSSEEIGPDYPGFAIKHLRNLLSKEGEPEGVLMFAQGCGGNINDFPLRGGFGACESAGLSLAFAVTRALTEYQTVTPAPLKSQSLNLSLPLRIPSVAECKELLAQNPDDQRIPALLELSESGEPRFLPFPMRAFAVGDGLCILSLPHEMFAEYQLFVNDTSPFEHTLVFAYTNGSESYVATKKDYDLGLAGGYEASPMGHAVSGMHRLVLQPSAEQLIEEGIMHLLSELKSE